MTAGDAARLHAWLSDPSVALVDPLTVRYVRDRLTSANEALVVARQPHGTLVVLERSRRLLELGRDTSALALLRWTEDGRLARAWTRLSDDSWTMIEPRAADAPWGLADRLWHVRSPSGEPMSLTTFEALPYECVDRIPALAEPARLPPGSGTTVLNLVAGLAADTRRSALTYTGPYPTEQLFVALLESFRHRTTEADPLAAFMEGRVAWDPAPHERVRLPSGVVASLRGRIEKVAWRGRLYHRPDAQGVHRRAHRRVRDAGDHVVCSLWALGEPLEDHLRLDADASRVEVLAPSRRFDAPPRPMPHAIVAGIGSAVAGLGAAPLGPFIRRIVNDGEAAWASLEGDLVSVEGPRLLVSHLLRDALARRLTLATTRPQRLALGLAALTELAHLLGDPLRAMAQSLIAALPPDTQAQLLTTPPPTQQTNEDAHRITRAIESLIADTTDQ